MRCPRCGERETRVIDSRDLDEVSIRRRRECAACSARFTTNERIEAPRLVIVKRDGLRQEIGPFEVGRNQLVKAFFGGLQNVGADVGRVVAELEQPVTDDARDPDASFPATKTT